MKRNDRRLTSAAAFVACAVGALAATTLTSSRADAHPVLLCGPSFQWICTNDECAKIPFVGTICDARIFERKNGVVCTR